MSNIQFTHLHCHSDYSAYDGFMSVGEMVSHTHCQQLISELKEQFGVHTSKVIEMYTNALAGSKKKAEMKADKKADKLAKKISKSLSIDIEEADKMVSTLVEYKMKEKPAIALTDHGKVGGFIKFQKACKKHGVKPIFGCEFYVVDNFEDKKSKRHHLVILAKNKAGYKNIIRLCSEAHKHMAYSFPRIDFEMLLAHKEGLVLSTACLGGEFARLIENEDIDGAYVMAQKYKDIWGEDFYLEVMWTGISQQKEVIKYAVECGKKTEIKIIATNDAHYARREDAKYQQVKKSISMGRPITVPDAEEYYLKSYEEMSQIFNKQGAEYLHNTMEIANKCNVEIEFGNAKLPNFNIPTNDEEYNKFLEEEYGRTGEQSYLRYLAYKGLVERNLQDREEYCKRIDDELETIGFTGFDRYFLIVWEYCQWSRERNIRLGAGRGSGVGSLVLYCLGVTDGIDPVKYEISMDRFLYSEAEYRTGEEDIFKKVESSELKSQGTGNRDRQMTKEEKSLSKSIVDKCKEILLKKPITNETEQIRLKEELQFVTKQISLVKDISRLIKGETIAGDANIPNSFLLYFLGITNKIADINKNFWFKFIIDKDQSRISPPDIDIDFEHREAILQHLCDLYGINNVALIGTEMRYKPKAAVQFSAKSIDITDTNTSEEKRFSSTNDKEGKRLSKLMTNLGISLRQWLGEDKDYKAPNRVVTEAMNNLQAEIRKGGKYSEVFEIAKRLEGRIKGFGTHAAGVVISSDPIIEDVPLHVAKIQRDTLSDIGMSWDDETSTADLMTTQFDMDEVEELGLLKFDFLQLNNLRQISLTLELIEKQHGKLDFDINTIEPNDPAVFKTINDLKLEGLFQISGPAFAGNNYPQMDKKTGEVKRNKNGDVLTYHSKGVMEIIGCQDFQDIVAPNALGRPGPLNLGMPKKYADGKKNPDTIIYPHESLKGILSKTYGQLIYQEQLIQMAQVLAGFSFAEADKLRKACAKKKKDLLAGIEPNFRNGCKTNNIPPMVVDQMWELCVKFGEYAFNLAHSSAYGFICYQTAYLKTHYPTEFLCSLLTSAANTGDDKLDIVTQKLQKEYKKLNILKPCINKSQYTFIPSGRKELEIISPLVSLKGIGKKASDNVVLAREHHGEFTSIDEFFRAVNSGGKSVISNNIGELLIDTGVFSVLGKNADMLKTEMRRYNQIKKIVSPKRPDFSDSTIAGRIRDLF